MKRTLIVLAVFALLLTSVGMAGAVTGNPQPDGENHPYVGLLVFDVDGVPTWRCSGTLLTPTLVLTAGHCTDGATAARVWFDELVQDNAEYPFSGATSYNGVAHTYPGFCIGCGNGLPGFSTDDVGVVVLTEPVPTSVVSVYGELPAAGVVDTLKNKAAVDLVGYGVQYQNRPGQVWAGLRNRFYAPTQLVAANFTFADTYLKLTANPAKDKGGTCFGDSGGPDLLGGTATVLGVNSFVTNGNCSGVTYSARVDRPKVLEWVTSFLN